MLGCRKRKGRRSKKKKKGDHLEKPLKKKKVVTVKK
jgi:hypothetical protein